MNIYLIFTISFLILSVLGTILHFTHSWFKNGLLLHIFSALNESTWEHMKLLVAPTILVGIFQYTFLRDEYGNILNGILVLLLVQTLAIPLIYEPLRIFFKKVPFPITIGIFFLSIYIGLLVEYNILKNEIYIFSENISLVLILLTISLFGIFSYFPPRVFLFRDPVTGKYGDYKHRYLNSK